MRSRYVMYRLNTHHQAPAEGTSGEHDLSRLTNKQKDIKTRASLRTCGKGDGAEMTVIIL